MSFVKRISSFGLLSATNRRVMPATDFERQHNNSLLRNATHPEMYAVNVFSCLFIPVRTHLTFEDVKPN